MDTVLPKAEELYQHLKQAVAQFIATLPADKVHLVGIYSGGAWLAQRLQKELNLSSEMGCLNISFYRDDFKRIGLHSQTKPSEITFDVEGKHLILIDDILFTGRTIRAAMNELFDYGRAASITLAVLLDRGGRELPIAASLCGAVIPLPQDKNFVLTHDENSLFEIVIEKDEQGA